jgi:hypothetical protein
MLDIIDTDAEEKYYLSPAGCAGIVRRKIERNAGINPQLEYHLRNGFISYPELINKKERLSPLKEYQSEELGLSVSIY